MDLLNFRRPETQRRLLVVLIFLLGITLRLFFISEQSPLLIEQHPPGSDMARYYNWAQKLYLGEGHQEVFFAGPLYPYLLSAVFKISGADLRVALALQIILGLASAYLLYRLALRYFSFPVALIALGLFLGYGKFILYEQVLLTDSLSVFLILLLWQAVVFFQKKLSLWRAAVCGAVLGLAALNRPLMLSFLLVLALWVFFYIPLSLYKRLIAIAVLGISVFLVVLPATLHNLRYDEGLVLISYNGGVNFYLGNGEGATGLFYYNPRYKEIQEEMKQENTSPSRQSRRWYQETVKHIKNNPGNFINLLWKKFNLFWGRWEIPHNLNYDLLASRYQLLRTGLFNFGFIAPWGLLGAFILLFSKKDSFISLLLWFTGYYTLSVILFLVVGRYSFPLVPVLMLFAAYSWWFLAEKLRQGEAKEALLYFLAGMLFWLFIHYKPLYTVMGV